VLYVSLFFDPFQPFKEDTNYSMTPFVLTAANIPAQLRWEPAYSACLSILPGNRSQGEGAKREKVSPLPFLQLVVDQLELASKIGIQVCMDRGS